MNVLRHFASIFLVFGVAFLQAAFCDAAQETELTLLLAMNTGNSVGAQAWDPNDFANFVGSRVKSIGRTPSANLPQLVQEAVIFRDGMYKVTRDFMEQSIVERPKYAARQVRGLPVTCANYANETCVYQPFTAPCKEIIRASCWFAIRSLCNTYAQSFPADIAHQEDIARICKRT